MNQNLKLPELPRPLQSISPNERVAVMESDHKQLAPTSNSFVQNLDQVLSTFLGFSKKDGPGPDSPRAQLLDLLRITTFQID